MGMFKKCKNCGKRNPIHVCYTGGNKNMIFFDREAAKEVEKLRQFNTARGDDPWKGVPSELRQAYMNQRDR